VAVQKVEHGADEDAEEKRQNQGQQEKAHVPAALAVRAREEQFFDVISRSSHIRA
jgi:cation transport regulator ChaB